MNPLWIKETQLIENAGIIHMLDFSIAMMKHFTPAFLNKEFRFK